jgi:hypothetical protein
VILQDALDNQTAIQQTGVSQLFGCIADSIVHLCFISKATTGTISLSKQLCHAKQAVID